jgi:hypothetical protein
VERIEDEADLIGHFDSQFMPVRDRSELMDQDLPGELNRHFVSLPMIGQIVPDTVLVAGFMAAIEEKAWHRSLLVVGRHNSR